MESPHTMSVATSCHAASDAIAKASSAIQSFVREVRESRLDLDVISGELYSLGGSLELLKDDIPSFPPTLAADTPLVLARCTAIVDEVRACIGIAGTGHHPRHARDDKYARWIACRPQILKLGASLEGYKSTLGLALDLVALTSSERRSPQTAGASGNGPFDRSHQRAIAAVVAEMVHLANRLNHEFRTDGAMTVLQAYIDTMLSQADVADANSPLVDRLEHRGRSSLNSDALDSAVDMASVADFAPPPSPIEPEGADMVTRGVPRESWATAGPRRKDSRSSFHSDMSEFLDELCEMSSPVPTPPPMALARYMSPHGRVSSASSPALVQGGPGGPGGLNPAVARSSSHISARVDDLDLDPSRATTARSLRRSSSAGWVATTPTPPQTLPPQAEARQLPPPQLVPQGISPTPTITWQVSPRPSQRSPAAATPPEHGIPYHLRRQGMYAIETSLLGGQGEANVTAGKTPGYRIASPDSGGGPQHIRPASSMAAAVHRVRPASGMGMGMAAAATAAATAAAHRVRPASSMAADTATVRTSSSDGQSTVRHRGRTLSGRFHKVRLLLRLGGVREEEDEAVQPTHHAAVFGVPLAQSLKVSKASARTHHVGSSGASRRDLPLCLFKCACFIRETGGTRARHIFEQAGDAGQVQVLRAFFSVGPTYGQDIDWAGHDAYQAADVMLQYLSELPKPLVGTTTARRWISLSRQAAASGAAGGRLDRCIDFWEEALGGMSGVERSTLKLLLNLWGDVADAAHANGMTAERLAGSLVRPLMHVALDDKSTSATDCVLALAFLIRQRSEYSVLVRSGKKG